MKASSCFTFSHGNLVKVAGHDPSLENLYEWEALWMTYTYWKKGFTLYALIENIIWYKHDD